MNEFLNVLVFTKKTVEIVKQTYCRLVIVE